MRTTLRRLYDAIVPAVDSMRPKFIELDNAMLDPERDTVDMEISVGDARELLAEMNSALREMGTSERTYRACFFMAGLFAGLMLAIVTR